MYCTRKQGRTEHRPIVLVMPYMLLAASSAGLLDVKNERYENRTRVSTLEGWNDNHYTNRPTLAKCFEEVGGMLVQQIRCKNNSGMR